MGKCKHKVEEFIDGEWVIITCPKCVRRGNRAGKKAKKAEWRQAQADAPWNQRGPKPKYRD